MGKSLAADVFEYDTAQVFLVGGGHGTVWSLRMAWEWTTFARRGWRRWSKVRLIGCGVLLQGLSVRK